MAVKYLFYSTITHIKILGQIIKNIVEINLTIYVAFRIIVVNYFIKHFLMVICWSSIIIILWQKINCYGNIVEFSVKRKDFWMDHYVSRL